MLKYTYESQKTEKKDVPDLDNYLDNRSFSYAGLHISSAYDSLKNMPKKGMIKSILFKLAFIVGFICLIFLMVSVAKEAHKKNQIQKIIDEMSSQAKKIEREKAEIADRISYLGSQDYQKKQLKDKFSLQEPDEKVVIIKPRIFEETPKETETVKRLNIEDPPMPNPIKWWNYFFEF